jgi:AAA domain-containing protein
LAAIGGGRYLADLATSTVTILNAEHYGRTIRDLYLRRQLLDAAETVVAELGSAIDKPIELLMAQHQLRLETCFPLSGHLAPNPFEWIEPKELPRREWVYGRHLVRGFVSCTIAPGGIGKTALLCAEALAMVTGRPLLGDAPQGRLRVWLVNLEDPIDELRRRIGATALQYGIGKDDIGGRLYLDSGRDMAIVVATDSREGVTVNRPVLDAIKREIANRCIDVLIIDPFVACHAVPENDNGKIAAVTRLWADIAEATGCAIELVHHSRKMSADQQLTADDARGASALIAAVRSARLLRQMTETEAKRAGVENSRLYFSIASGKANLAPPANRAIWRRLTGILLCNGSSPEDPGDDVGVVEPWRWPDPFSDMSTEAAREVQRRIHAGEFRADQRAKYWAGYVVLAVLGWDRSDTSAVAAVKKLLEGWLETGALKLVERANAKRMKKQFVEVGQWLAQ